MVPTNIRSKRKSDGSRRALRRVASPDEDGDRDATQQ
jgi:hypothetical protein